MREIKFRVWDDVEKEYITIAEKFCFDDIQEIIDFECDGIEFRKNKRYIFEQYTGMKDCDGTEIYEGDILKDTNDGFVIGAVEWDDEDLEYFVDDRLCNYYSQEVQVCGNIYENPELIKEVR